MICWKCKEDIGEFDNYCRYCGAGQGKHISFYYKPWGVWLLYLFLGPFALYFVLRSPVIGKAAKWVNTVLMIGFFCWFCYSFTVAVKNIMDMYTQLLSGDMDFILKNAGLLQGQGFTLQ